MQLLELPSELVCHIFENLGGSFFRSNIALLSINKTWLEFAKDILYTDLLLRPRKLEKFLQVMRNAEEQQRLERHLRTVQLRIRRNDLFSKREQRENAALAEAFENPRGDSIVANWKSTSRATISALLVRLGQLPPLLKQCKALHSLHVYAPNIIDSFHCVQDANHSLGAKSISPLFELEHLTTLSLDASGMASMLAEAESIKYHFCTMIAGSLGKLKYLYLRLRNICPAAFDLPAECGRLSLKELEVSLSCNEGRPPHDERRESIWSRPCYSKNLREYVADSERFRMPLRDSVRGLAGPQHKAALCPDYLASSD